VSKLAKLIMLGMVAILMLGLSACGDVSSSKDYSYNEFTVTLKDGRTMPCVGHSSALDCDWSKLK
jgi:hypothetical protein